jgi:hypothetical protein
MPLSTLRLLGLCLMAAGTLTPAAIMCQDKADSTASTFEATAEKHSC